MEYFLKKVKMKRPISEYEDVVQCGVDEINIKRIYDEENEFEVEIIKKVKGLFNINIVYFIKLDEDKGREYLKNELLLEDNFLSAKANLLVSTMLEKMNYPPFPNTLGSLNDYIENGGEGEK